MWDGELFIGISILEEMEVQNIGSKVCFDNRYLCFGGNHYVGHVAACVAVEL